MVKTRKKIPALPQQVSPQCSQTVTALHVATQRTRQLSGNISSVFDSNSLVCRVRTASPVYSTLQFQRFPAYQPRASNDHSQPL